MNIDALMTYLQVNVISAVVAIGGALLMLAAIVKGYDWISDMIFERQSDKEWREDLEAREREYDQDNFD